MPFSLLDGTLSNNMTALIRAAYGLLLLLLLSSLLPNARKYFTSERWGGYCSDTESSNLLLNPVSSAIILALWLSCAVCLIEGVFVLPALCLNVVFCHSFCIGLRWKSISRGFGAPGFMTYWLGVAVLLTELTAAFAPNVRALALLTLQIDFALIMLSAGFYKLKAGYAHNEGMEYGMVNPQWGYWASFFKNNFSPAHPLFKILNHLAWSLEVIGGVLMLLPSARLLGAFIILSSFLFITTQIRLGVLCEIVMLCCFLFATKGSAADNLLSAIVPSYSPISQTPLPGLEAALTCVLLGYLILTPLAHAGLFYNLLKRKSLPQPWQTILEVYTNTFGIIIWRVFSADLTNFFIRIYSHRKSDPYASGNLLTRWGWNGNWRFNNVCESITLTSLFTTRKYHPSDLALFQSRLLRYARTLSTPKDSVLTFEYVAITKQRECFAYETKVLYVVDPDTDEVTENSIDEAFSTSDAHKHSPIFAGARPGSYVPDKR